MTTGLMCKALGVGFQITFELNALLYFVLRATNHFIELFYFLIFINRVHLEFIVPTDVPPFICTSYA